MLDSPATPQEYTMDLPTLFSPSDAPVLDDAIVQANVERAINDPWYLKVSEDLAKADLTTPLGIVQRQMFILVCIAGPAMAANLVPYQPPRAKASTAPTIPSGIDAAIEVLCAAMETAAYDACPDILARVRSGDIKSTGLPDDVTDFGTLVIASGRFQVALSTSDRRYPAQPVGDDPKVWQVDKTGAPKETRVAFGWRADAHRPEPKTVKKVKVSTPVADTATAPDATADAPADA